MTDKIINFLAWKIAKAQLYYLSNKEFVETWLCFILGFSIGVAIGLVRIFYF